MSMNAGFNWMAPQQLLSLAGYGSIDGGCSIIERQITFGGALAQKTRKGMIGSVSH
jgi:hypothetical protein